LALSSGWLIILADDKIFLALSSIWLTIFGIIIWLDEKMVVIIWPVHNVVIWLVTIIFPEKPRSLNMTSTNASENIETRAYDHKHCQHIH
jgi:hypothetical protein